MSRLHRDDGVVETFDFWWPLRLYPFRDGMQSVPATTATGAVKSTSLHYFGAFHPHPCLAPPQQAIPLACLSLVMVVCDKIMGK